MGDGGGWKISDAELLRETRDTLIKRVWLLAGTSTKFSFYHCCMYVTTGKAREIMKSRDEI